jgi:DNA-directed RNA polymerase specialized sigma24 family protein
MSVATRPAHVPGLSRIRAERLLRSDFEAQRARVLAAARGRLAASGVRLDPADLDACYAQAWQGLYARVLAGERVSNPPAWLVLATYRRAIEEWRLLHPARRAGAPDAELDTGAAPAEERLDDLDRLRAVFEALRGRLDRRECQAASLCYLQGLTRAQAAARMGISERRMRKLMEGDGAAHPGVAGKVSELVLAIREGRWCEEQSSLMRAYAFGLLDPEGERHALAVAHQRRCPACRAYVASLRGLAAIVPPGTLPLAGLAGGTAGVAGGGGLLLAGSGAGKLAAGCVAALALGGACVAAGVHLAGPASAPHSRAAHGSPRQASRPAVRVMAAKRAGARPHSARREAPASARVAGHATATSPAARTLRTAAEFTPLRTLVPASTPARTAARRAAARRAPASAAAPSKHAAREFGFE